MRLIPASRMRRHESMSPINEIGVGAIPVGLKPGSKGCDSQIRATLGDLDSSATGTSLSASRIGSLGISGRAQGRYSSSTVVGTSGSSGWLGLGQGAASLRLADRILMSQPSPAASGQVRSGILLGQNLRP